jgi:hypothetical protein
MKPLLLVISLSAAGCVATPMPLPLDDASPWSKKDAGPVRESGLRTDAPWIPEASVPPPVGDGGQSELGDGLGDGRLGDGLGDGLKDAVGEKLPEAGPGLDGGTSGDLLGLDGTPGKD